MKKIIILLSIVSSLYLFNNQNDIIIPKDAIRFRIIANSNSIEDQSIKNTIKDDLIENIFPNINNNIEDNLENIKNEINKYNIDYDISYGSNYFPEKKYKGITYPQGYYKSLVITLGNGVGNNFWCVMYPPLCLVEKNSSTDNIEYKSLVIDTLKKYQEM